MGQSVRECAESLVDTETLPAKGGPCAAQGSTVGSFKSAAVSRAISRFAWCRCSIKISAWNALAGQYFCQISDSTTSYGSYSGAVPNEKITWGSWRLTLQSLSLKATLPSLLHSCSPTCWAGKPHPNQYGQSDDARPAHIIRRKDDRAMITIKSRKPCSPQLRSRRRRR